MATLSKRLDLVAGIWQEIGSTDFIAQQNNSQTLELVNADALPVGDIQEAQTIASSANLQFTAPATGSLYVRVRSGSATLCYYEV